MEVNTVPIKLSTLRSRLRRLLGEDDTTDSVNRYITAAFSVVIVINILAVMLSTVDAFAERYSGILYLIELISVIIFTIEYVLRLWAHGKLRAVFNPLMLVDLLAILPFYLPMVMPVDLRFLRVLRLMRIFRILKLARYSHALQVIGRVVRSKGPEITVVGFVVIIMLTIASSLMYYAEHELQPVKFSSIPESLWWGVVTLTTVGYGDVFPITPIGKLLGAVISFLGIGLFALPAGILGSGFIEEFQKQRQQPQRCPHCGKLIDKGSDENNIVS